MMNVVPKVNAGEEEGLAVDASPNVSKVRYFIRPTAFDPELPKRLDQQQVRGSSLWVWIDGIIKLAKIRIRVESLYDRKPGNRAAGIHFGESDVAPFLSSLE
jgi:hypothetical protein